jgi:hypothetical protein
MFGVMGPNYVAIYDARPRWVGPGINDRENIAMNRDKNTKRLGKSYN